MPAIFIQLFLKASNYELGRNQNHYTIKSYEIQLICQSTYFNIIYAKYIIRAMFLVIFATIPLHTNPSISDRFSLLSCPEKNVTSYRILGSLGQFLGSTSPSFLHPTHCHVKFLHYRASPPSVPYLNTNSPGSSQILVTQASLWMSLLDLFCKLGFDGE